MSPIARSRRASIVVQEPKPLWSACCIIKLMSKCYKKGPSTSKAPEAFACDSVSGREQTCERWLSHNYGGCFRHTTHPSAILRIPQQDCPPKGQCGVQQLRMPTGLLSTLAIVRPVRRAKWFRGNSILVRAFVTEYGNMSLR